MRNEARDPDGHTDSAHQQPLGLSLVIAYYENPEMLAFQYHEWAKYPEALKRRIELIIVDDGSPLNPAVAVSRPGNLPQLSIFRILQDVPWNQDAARNIGAFEAEAPWLLLTDIDHVAPPETVEALLAMEKIPESFYSLGRIKFDSNEAREPHPNSYLMGKELYWKIGGHDEDFAGIYGKDFLFRKRAQRIATETALPALALARVGTTLVPDAGTTTITRRNTLRLKIWGYILAFLKSIRLWRGVQTLQHEYTRDF